MESLEIVQRSAVPTIGFWRRGSIVMNDDYAAGEAVFWVCTVSGEPGTWRAVGLSPDGVIIGTTDTQTLTNKTINLASNTLTGTTAEFNTALSDANFATLAGTEALTNKTLTSPVVNTPTTTAGVGAKNGATVTAVENFPGVFKTVLTLAATPLAVTDALAYAGVKVYDFPEGRIFILGVTGSIQWAVTSDRTTTINDNASLTWGLGTATASNATLATTMVDLIPKTTKVLSAAAATLNTASTAALAAAAQFDGTGTPSDAYLNAAFETGTDIDADGTLTATGTLTITWLNLGDY